MYCCTCSGVGNITINSEVYSRWPTGAGQKYKARRKPQPRRPGFAMAKHPTQRKIRIGSHLSYRRSGSSVKRLARRRSEEHTSELQSLMRISYAVFCLKKKKKKTQKHTTYN